MKYGLDTNILVYAEDYRADKKCDISLRLLEFLDELEVCVPLQVLGELQRVLVIKAGRAPQAIRDLLLQYSDAYSVRPTTHSAFFSALELSTVHKLSIWDSIVLSVCAESGCRVLFSEDMQDGFTWEGVTVVNPYSRSHSPAVKALLPGGF